MADDKRLAVITSYFNPAKYKTRRKLHAEVKLRIAALARKPYVKPITRFTKEYVAGLKKDPDFQRSIALQCVGIPMIYYEYWIGCMSIRLVRSRYRDNTNTAALR